MPTRDSIAELKSVEHLAMLFATLVQVWHNPCLLVSLVNKRHGHTQGKWVVHSTLVLKDIYEQLCR